MSRLLTLYLFAPRFIQPNPSSLFLTPLTSQQDKSFRNDQSNQRGSTLNKAELAEEIADQTGLTKKTSREAIDAVISAITDSLAREERVTLVGFGTFQVMQRKARRGRNPQTGEGIQIPAKKIPKFKAGKSLREKIK